MDKFKVAITGSSGYIGFNITKTAINWGMNVVPIVRSEKSAGRIGILGITPKIVTEFEIDVFKSVFEDCDAVIHLIAKSDSYQDSYEKINLGSLKVVAQASFENGIKRIIFISGLGVHEFGKKSWANNEYFQSKILTPEI